MRKAFGLALAVVAVAAGVRVGATALTGDGGCTAGPDPVPTGAPSQADRSEQAGLWVINVDGTGETKLGDVSSDWWQGGLHGFGWSSDGTAIGYTSADSGGVVIVDAAPPEAGLRLHGADVPPGPYVMGRAWSPDARQIVWPTNGLEIESPGGVRRIVVPASIHSNLRDPAWSPDGSRIAFEAHGGYYGTWLGVVNADGSGLRRIARHCAGTGPAWSPDGQRLAFIRV